MEKTFSKIEIAIIKRTAQNVAQYVNKKEKLLAEIEKIKASRQEMIDKLAETVDAKIAAKVEKVEAELAVVQPMIDSFQTPIKDLTGGYTTEDLVTKEVTPTGKMDDKGREICQTRFILKYPETVVPLYALTTADVPGTDFDADKEETASVVEEEIPEKALDPDPEYAAQREEAESAFVDNVDNW